MWINRTSTCAGPLEKPGKCPAPRPDLFGVCANQCARDSDCKGADKCCRNPCGAFTCQHPVGIFPPRPSCKTVVSGVNYSMAERVSAG